MAIDSLRQKYHICQLIKLAGIPRSTYYYHQKQVSAPDKYQKEKDAIKEIYQDNHGRYGYRRITLALHNRGLRLNHKTVRKLMRELRLYCHVRMKKYRSYRGEVGQTAPNLLERDFHATKPNQKWVTDVTEIQLLGKKLYLSPIIDLYNGEVISYNLSYHPDFEQITDMLNQAFERIPDTKGIVLHSDQGWQYRMEKYRTILSEKGMIQSMSRKGNCFDNACAENFFSILKTELLYLRSFDSIEQFIDELNLFFLYYNFHRIKLRLKGCSPVQYRLKYDAA